MFLRGAKKDSNNSGFFEFAYQEDPVRFFCLWPTINYWTGNVMWMRFIHRHTFVYRGFFSSAARKSSYTETNDDQPKSYKVGHYGNLRDHYRWPREKK